MIVGRPPQLGDQAFRVRLDAEVPFKMVGPPCPTISRTASSLAEWAAVRAANILDRNGDRNLPEDWVVAGGVVGWLQSSAGLYRRASLDVEFVIKQQHLSKRTSGKCDLAPGNIVWLSGLRLRSFSRLYKYSGAKPSSPLH